MARWLWFAAFTLVMLAPLSFPARTWAQPAPAPRGKSHPDVKDGKYGPHERNVFDLWKASSDKPTPLVVYIHGGGFYRGRKESLSSVLLAGLLKHGVSVMAINYRLTPEVTFPAHYTDCARAIQFARSQSTAWNIDPQQIGCTGGSAGAGTALWIAFHDEMAAPQSSDPVLRQSTRLACVAVTDAQTSYDPQVIKEWVSEAASRHPMLPPFYGVTAEERDAPRAIALYEAASPTNLLTSDDPAVYAYYSEDGPIPPDAKPGQGIHHVNFGIRLKERMDDLNIPCTIRSRSDGANWDEEMAAFLVEHLR